MNILSVFELFLRKPLFLINFVYFFQNPVKKFLKSILLIYYCIIYFILNFLYFIILFIDLLIGHTKWLVGS